MLWCWLTTMPVCSWAKSLPQRTLLIWASKWVLHLAGIWTALFWLCSSDQRTLQRCNTCKSGGFCPPTNLLINPCTSWFGHLKFDQSFGFRFTFRLVCIGLPLYATCSRRSQRQMYLEVLCLSCAASMMGLDFYFDWFGGIISALTLGPWLSFVSSPRKILPFRLSFVSSLSSD